MTEKLENIISSFEPITLQEMDSVKLMDRTDTKFVFQLGMLPGILEEIKPFYRLLEINGTRCHRYESLYFDTDDFELYNSHHNGKLNRFKLRYRKYTNTNGLTFFEVKFKNNKDRTIKKRVKAEKISNGISGKQEEFLRKITPFSPEIFSPKLWVHYYRMTFVNKVLRERLTVDIGLNYAKPSSENLPHAVQVPQLVIAEAKREHAAMISPFIRALRRHAVRAGGISKYCFGIASLYEEVRKNTFKERISYIYKTINAPQSLAG